jgi:hypothetical protein
LGITSWYQKNKSGLKCIFYNIFGKNKSLAAVERVRILYLGHNEINHQNVILIFETPILA